MKPVNVLYLIRSWAFGGSHAILLLLMRHLPRDRFNIICVPYDAFSNGDALFIEQAQKQGITVAPERVRWKSRTAWFEARRTVSELIAKYTIDLIHTHDPHSNIMLGIGRKRWPCACVASAYGWWDKPWRRVVHQTIERDFALRHYERVITVSEHMKTRILMGTTPKDRIRVIHTGLDPERLRYSGSRSDARKKFGIQDEACVIGTVSRLSAEKGHCHLIAAAAKLVPQHPDLRLLIIGDGPARAELTAQVDQLNLRGNVILPGFCDDLPEALAAMDIFAQPSVEQEGLPTSVLEAQAVGLPVVASDIGGTSESIEAGITGVLTKPGDEAALGDALASLMDNPARRDEMSRAARERISSQFTIPRMVDQVAAAYGEARDLYASR